MAYGIVEMSGGNSEITFDYFKQYADRFKNIYFYAPLKENAKTYQGGIWNYATIVGNPSFDGQGVSVNSTNYISNCGKPKSTGNASEQLGEYLYSEVNSTFETIIQRDSSMSGSALAIYGSGDTSLILTSSSATTMQITHGGSLRGTISNVDFTQPVHIAIVRMKGLSTYKVYANGIYSFEYSVPMVYPSGLAYLSWGFSAGWTGFIGKISGILITNRARYNANFTPPTDLFDCVKEELGRPYYLPAENQDSKLTNYFYSGGKTVVVTENEFKSACFTASCGHYDSGKSTTFTVTVKVDGVVVFNKSQGFNSYYGMCYLPFFYEHKTPGSRIEISFSNSFNQSYCSMAVSVLE